MKVYLGLDVGTTAVKGAVVDDAGELLGAETAPMPPVERQGTAAWQEAGAVLDAVHSVLDPLLSAAPAPRWIALTTQRDTVIAVDARGKAVTPLVSWLDARDRRGRSLWDVLSDEGVRLGQVAQAHSLASHLAFAWGGEPAEALGTFPRHLAGTSKGRLDRLAGRDVGAPHVVPVGMPVASYRDVQVRAAGGDKNCEHLAMGVGAPGPGGLSLGSAVSLGMIARARPDGALGIVVTPASVAGSWNVETGLLGGADGERFLAALGNVAPALSTEFAPEPWMVPYFAGALDAPGATMEIVGAEPTGTGAPLLRQAWAQGVLGELRRLLPRVEVAVGARLETLTVGGGGAADPAWGQLAADALRVPVRHVADRWLGARGAIAAVLSAEPGGIAGAFVRAGLGGGLTFAPLVAREPIVSAYYDEWNRLSHAARVRSAAPAREGTPA